MIGSSSRKDFRSRSVRGRRRVFCFEGIFRDERGQVGVSGVVWGRRGSSERSGGERACCCDFVSGLGEMGRVFFPVV